MEDGEYFQTLPENTIFILLRPGEAWGPAGEDIVSQGDDDDDDIYIMMKCLSVTFLLIRAPSPSPGFHASRWVFMVPGRFSIVPGRLFMVPGRF